MQLYSYAGPVEYFGRCVADNWKASTYAESEKKARSNFEYQFKKRHGLMAGSRITLPGKIVMVEGKEEHYG